MKIIDQIFCDDIRLEQNNKISLMGLYGDRILFKISPEKAAEIKWPIPIKLSLFLRFEREKEEIRPDRFEFNYILNNNSLPIVRGSINIDINQIVFNFILGAEGLLLGPGMLGFNLKMYLGNLVIFQEKKENAIRIECEQQKSP